MKGLRSFHTPTLSTAALLVASAALAAAEAPRTVSPGSYDRIVREAARCPTFSWGAQPGATGYELIVFRLPEEAPGPVAIETTSAAEGAIAALRIELPAGVSTWTPSLDRCLESGPRYAWMVRARSDDGAADWSEARLFTVDAVAVQSELENVMREALESYLAQRLDPAAAGPGSRASEQASPTVAAPVDAADRGPGAAAPLPVGETSFRSQLPASAGLGSTAIFGESLPTAQASYGVRGISRNTQVPADTADPERRSAGVRGESIGGATFGVLGVTSSPNDEARGVFGKATASGGVAIEGLSTASDTRSAVPDSLGTGVRGVSEFDGGRGVEGLALGSADGLTDPTGVFGESSSGTGVHGRALSGVGVFGSATGGTGGRFEAASSLNPALQVENQLGTGLLTIGGDIDLELGDATAGVLSAPSGFVDVLSDLRLPTGNLNMEDNLVLDIGASGTDFTAGGGLTLAGLLTANGGITTGAIQLTDVLSLTPRSAAPSTPQVGDLYVDSDFSELCFWDGSWRALVSGNDANCG